MNAYIILNEKYSKFKLIKTLELTSNNQVVAFPFLFTIDCSGDVEKS